MLEALKLIAARSTLAAGDAIKCIRAIDNDSPAVQHRYNSVVEVALNDPGAEFSGTERAQILAHVVSTAENEARTLDVRVRVNQAEKAAIQEMAAKAGLTVSDFIRDRLEL